MAQVTNFGGLGNSGDWKIQEIGRFGELGRFGEIRNSGKYGGSGKLGDSEGWENSINWRQSLYVVKIKKPLGTPKESGTWEIQRIRKI